MIGWLRRLIRPTPCRVCGIPHGPLMTINMRGRLTAEDAPRWLLLKHFARQVAATQRLGEMLERRPRK